MVKYVYDAWGNHKVLDASGSVITSTTHIGNLNPFRYRSYYYDTETGLYYLKSRYYDPETGRFISADGLSYVNQNHVNGTNLYAYCYNNPVMCKQFATHSGGNMNDCYPHNAKGKIDPVTGMLKSYSLGLNSVYGAAFRGKYFFGHIKATLLHADWSAGLDMQDRLLIGVFGEFSAIKLDGQIGVGVDELNLSLVGRADILTASGMAGLVIDPAKDKYFLGFDASVTALSLQAGTRVNIFGFQLEGGVTLDVGTIGGGFGIGYDKGKIKFCGGFKYGIGYGFYVVIDISKFLH